MREIAGYGGRYIHGEAISVGMVYASVCRFSSSVWSSKRLFGWVSYSLAWGSGSGHGTRLAGLASRYGGRQEDLERGASLCISLIDWGGLDRA